MRIKIKMMMETLKMGPGILKPQVATNDKTMYRAAMIILGKSNSIKQMISQIIDTP